MYESKRNRWLGAMIASALLVSACGKDKEEPPVSVLTDSSGILRYVPADTPYVLGNTAPLPDDFLDMIEPSMDQMLKAYQGMLEGIGEVIEESAADSAGDMDAEQADKAKKAVGIISELASLLSIEGLRSVGITRESRAVFYGNGLLPVLRMELSDSKLFDDTIARLEAEAGETMPVASIGSQSYRYIDADGARFIIATIDDQAVMTIAPATFDDGQLSTLLGLELPARNIAQSGELKEIAEKYDFTPHYVGLVSATRIADTFLDDPTGLNAGLMAMMDEAERPELSDVCKSEIRSMVAIAPRMALGYNEISTEQVTTSIIVEMRDDISQGLKGVTAAVPGLGQDLGGMMSFGMSLNPLSAREFYEARLDAIEADPYQCEIFAELQAGVAQGRAALSQPVPPMVYDFRGFLAVVDNMEGFDPMGGAPPTDIDARVMLAMENAEALVMMGAMMVPALANLNLEANGEPVPLDPSMLAGTGLSDASVVLGENALALGVGEGAGDGLKDLMAADTVEPSPFFSMNMDAEKYFEFVTSINEMQSAMAAAEAGDDPEAAAILEATQGMSKDIMEAFRDLYDRIILDVYFTDNGVEMKSVVTFAE